MKNKENTISVNELRVGNTLIKTHKSFSLDTCLINVDIDVLKDINDITLCDFKYEGIELTEEILLKIEGIEKDNEWYSLTNLHYNILTKRFYIGNDHVSSGHDDAYIEYLHQFQNLYFNLKNKELKFQV